MGEYCYAVGCVCAHETYKTVHRRAIQIKFNTLRRRLWHSINRFASKTDHMVEHCDDFIAGRISN